MSPEGLAHMMDSYLESLKHQVATAEAFHFGRIAEGMEKMLELPERVRFRIDQLIWDAAKGEPIDPTEESSTKLIVQAILFSVEERMGFHDA